MAREKDRNEERRLSIVAWPSGSRRCILFSVDTMRARKMTTGAPVAITTTTTTTTPATTTDWCIGAAWPSFSLAADTVSVHSDLIHPASPLSQPGTLVQLKAPPGLLKGNTLPLAATIELVPIDSLPQQDGQVVMLLAREQLAQRSYARIGDQLTLTVDQLQYAFRIASATTTTTTANDEVAPCFSISRATAVALRSSSPPPPDDASSTGATLLTADDAYTALGGLDAQIAEIRSLVELPLLRPDLFSAYSLRPPRGVLLYGPPGTGKTSLARAVALSTRSAALVINGPELSSAYHGETEQKLRNVFDEAKRRSPCIIIIDEIDALAPRRDPGTGDAATDGAGEVERRVVATLLTLLDGADLDTSSSFSSGQAPPRVVVLAATNRPNALDPALRRPGRLDREIEIGKPTAQARAAILAVQLQRVPHSCTPQEIVQIASRALGYVGADLEALVREAGMRAIRRVFQRDAQGDLADRLAGLSVAADLSPITTDDLLASMSVVKASALREIAFETPQVRWADISVGTGSGLQLQQRLRSSIEWPLQHPQSFSRLGIDVPRGVLLYGPPGCSKTLMARALATESGLHFIPVAGPELFNKYVGESERALRETFRKARSAAPCIVFFDELDALTTARGADTSASDRVIGTLLNELDGIGRGSSAPVIVVAATNRPQVIDAALLRPGRFDRLLYVGPPDASARLAMLRARCARIPLAPDVDLERVATQTDGCSGAEVIAICQDAGLVAMTRDLDAPAVTDADFAQALAALKRSITPAMLAQYEQWQKSA